MSGEHKGGKESVSGKWEQEYEWERGALRWPSKNEWSASRRVWSERVEVWANLNSEGACPTLMHYHTTLNLHLLNLSCHWVCTFSHTYVYAVLMCKCTVTMCPVNRTRQFGVQSLPPQVSKLKFDVWPDFCFDTHFVSTCPGSVNH